QPCHCVEIDVALYEVSEPGDPEKRSGVEDVRPDDLRQGERVDHHHHEPEERPAPHRRQPDDEAENRAYDHRADLVALREQERRVARLHASFDERLRDQADTTEHERSAYQVALSVLRTVAERARDGNAG